MKYKYKVFFVVLFFSKIVFSQTPPHIPLDLSSHEYQKLLDHYKNKPGVLIFDTLQSETQKAIEGGEKLSQWLKLMNRQRSAEDQIRLTSKETRKGVPIDSPNKYNERTIKEKYDTYTQEIPSEIIDVVYGQKQISAELPLEKETFIEHARKIDRLYQSAVRWTTIMLPWKTWYIENKKRDVRGYYYLNQESNLDEKLHDFQNLDLKTQDSFKEYLIGLCENEIWTTHDECVETLTTHISKNALVEYKNKYWRNSQSTWRAYFEIRDPRRDITWTTQNPQKAMIPFINPKNKKILDFLKFNIEDEFKNNQWQLSMKFVNSGLDTAEVQFRPGVTPHVSSGNIIVMDANTPLEEYEVKWTIRHEFGHILRLPDCYVEFYDTNEDIAINYQLDTTDLMCSRAGDFNERIYTELKRVYFR